MEEIERIFAGLRKSSFRRRFHLGPRERAYLDAKGLDAVMAHAAEFIGMRLAPAERREADAVARPSRVHRAARHGDLLPLLPLQVAWDSARPRARWRGDNARAGGAGALAARADVTQFGRFRPLCVRQRRAISPQ